MNQYTRNFIRGHLLEILLSIPKTVYFNFKVLPIRHAVLFPFVVSYHVKLVGINRTTFIVQGDKFPTASMRIGFGDSITSRRESAKSLLHISGGGRIEVRKGLGLSQGCVISAQNGTVSLGERFRCNYSTTIDCSGADITIGNDVVFGWNVTVKNNDGHYVIENNQTSLLAKKILIHDHVWICAFATLLKGVSVGKNSVVAYGSLLTRAENEEHVLYGGVPAKVLKERINWKE